MYFYVFVLYVIFWNVSSPELFIQAELEIDDEVKLSKPRAEDSKFLD